MYFALTCLAACPESRKPLPRPARSLAPEKAGHEKSCQSGNFTCLIVLRSSSAVSFTDHVFEWCTMEWTIRIET